MFEKFKFRILMIITLMLVIYIIPFQNIPNYVSYAFSQKKALNISMSIVNQNIKAIAADPSNQLLIKADVTNAMGQPVPKAHIVFQLASPIGELSEDSIRTDKNGQAIIKYIPPVATSENTAEKSSKVKITCSLSGSTNTSQVEFTLIKNPVVMVHGYNSGGYTFDNMKEFLSNLGYECYSPDYKSKEGVVASALELEAYLKQLSLEYSAKGIQVKKFDIISHSMGGLVTQYYTSNQSYTKNNNVRKIIFISVPHKGSIWASVASGYYNDKGVNDLIPDNAFLSKTLPSSINKGLNPTIQVGSLIDQYDEVVTLESASLEAWKIKTEVFSVGDNNLTMGNILSGNIIQSANHAIILNNTRVFETVARMLENELPYPVIRK